MILRDRAPLQRPYLIVLSLLLSAPVLGQLDCPPLPPPTGPTVEVTASQASQLRSLVANATSGTTLLLHDGLYDMGQGDSSSRLSFNTPGVTLRSFSGDRSAVVLDGNYGTNELVSIHASDVVIASITLRRAFNHPIHVSGDPAPISGVVIHDVRIIDPGEQAIKINPVGQGWVDDGVIECSSLELTTAGRSQVRNNCYTGGIDAHAARGWWIRRNRIEGFWCEQGLSEHGIHFWQASRETLVEENIIVNCARGIGFGLGSSGNDRDYPNDPYPTAGYLGHIDGIVRHNFVAATDPALFDSDAEFDAGLTFDQARWPLVVHNTVVSAEAPFSSIEWRFANTQIDLANNLVSHNLRPRDGGQAVVGGNLTEASPAWFIDPNGGNLHLVADGLPPAGAGVALAAGVADQDIDAQPRAVPPDVGADEWSEMLFRDGFESGTTAAWAALRSN